MTRRGGGDAWRPWKFGEPWRLKHYVQREDLDGDELARGFAPMADPFKIAGLLYERMARLGLDYAESPRTVDGTEQIIRQPYRVIASKRAGSCLDLSLVYAALCMTAGLLPMIALLEYGRGNGRHALVLIPNQQVGARRPRGIAMDRFAPDDVWRPSADELRAEIDAGAWTAVETVRMTTRGGGPDDFEGACAAGREAFDRPCGIAVVNVASPERALGTYAVDMPLANRHPRPRAPVERTGFAERAEEEIRRRFPDADLPPVLDVPSLERARRTVGRDGADVVDALIAALRAKQTFETIGGGRPRLEELHLLFFEATSRRVGAGSADVLLVEAALRRHREAAGLGQLARFMLNVAHGNGVGLENPALTAWLDQHGAQRADAEEHLRARPEKHWALIHIGGPEAVGAGHASGGRGDDPATVRISVEVSPAITPGRIPPRFCSPQEVPDALGGLVDDLYAELDGREILIDLVAPRRYLDRGYERLGKAARRVRHRPRLRWYGHVWDDGLRKAQHDRHKRADWAERPALVPDGAELGTRPLDDWLWSEEAVNRPCLVAGRRDGDARDLLEELLAEGCGHIVWFPGGGHGRAGPALCDMWDALHPANRNAFFPDEAMASTDAASVIWNEPDGRSGFRLSGFTAPRASGKLRGTRKRKRP